MKFAANVIVALAGLALGTTAYLTDDTDGRGLKSKSAKSPSSIRKAKSGDLVCGENTMEVGNECVLSPSACFENDEVAPFTRPVENRFFGEDNVCRCTSPGFVRRELINEHDLLALIEGEERDVFLKAYEELEAKRKTRGLKSKSLSSTTHPTLKKAKSGSLVCGGGTIQVGNECIVSPFICELAPTTAPRVNPFNRDTNRCECVNPSPVLRRNLLDKRDLQNRGDAPWAAPSSSQAKLLAADPGIWTVEDFLSSEESDKLLGIIKKNGYNKGMFGPCTDPMLQERGHPHFESSNKVCFKMSSENLYNELFFKKAQLTEGKIVNEGSIKMEGNCGRSACSAETDPEDGDFLTAIMSKVKALWETDADPRPHVSVVLSTGTSPPLRPHHDGGILASLVLYLTDGGAATIFQHANVTIVPKKGNVATWLNVDKDGKENEMAMHAVQAHPGSAGERATVNIFFRDLSPDEFVASQEDHRSRLL